MIWKLSKEILWYSWKKKKAVVSVALQIMKIQWNKSNECQADDFWINLMFHSLCFHFLILFDYNLYINSDITDSEYCQYQVTSIALKNAMKGNTQHGTVSL